MGQQKQQPARSPCKGQHESCQDTHQPYPGETVSPQSGKDQGQRKDKPARQVESAPREQVADSHHLRRKKQQKIVIAKIHCGVEGKMRWDVAARHQGYCWQVLIIIEDTQARARWH